MQEFGVSSEHAMPTLSPPSAVPSAHVASTPDLLDGRKAIAHFTVSYGPQQFRLHELWGAEYQNQMFLVNLLKKLVDETAL